MKLSTKGKYGLYAMVYLAEHEGEGPQSLKAIAELGMPDTYLEQLLGALRRAELVKTVRGAQGGYQLSRPPEEISMRDIIEATEGPVSFSDCVGDREHNCPRVQQCPAKGVWEFLTQKTNGLMEGITLRDMVNQNIKGDA